MWYREIVGHTVMCTRVLNLHQPKKGVPPKGVHCVYYIYLVYHALHVALPQSIAHSATVNGILFLAVRESIPSDSLECLLQWGKSRHGYLFESALAIPKSQSKVESC